MGETQLTRKTGDMNKARIEAGADADIPDTPDDGSWIWHFAVLVLALATSAVAVWNLVESAGAQALPPLEWMRGIAGIVIPLVVIATWLWARPRIDRRAVHLTLMIVATIAILVLTWSYPGFAGALSFLMPLTWLAAPGPRSAMAWTTILMASASIGMVLGGIANPWFVVFTAIFSIALSAAIGLSIQKLHAQVQIRQHLLEELQQKQDEVSLLSAESAAARERAAVLRDVHDAVTQNLTAIVMQARMPGHDPKLIEELAEEALEETRALLLKSTPRQLGQGATTAIARLAERFERETGIDVRTELAQTPLSLEGEIVLLRVAQEALANVRKHSRASSVAIELRSNGSEATLHITDDGIGFDGQSGASGQGLQGIRERVSAAGGNIEIDGSAGTSLTVALPLKVNV